MPCKICNKKSRSDFCKNCRKYQLKSEITNDEVKRYLNLYYNFMVDKNKVFNLDERFQEYLIEKENDTDIRNILNKWIKKMNSHKLEYNIFPKIEIAYLEEMKDFTYLLKKEDE